MTWLKKAVNVSNGWDKLDQMERAYLECALWAETDNSTDAGGEPLDHNYDISAFTPEAIAKAKEDCKQFSSRVAELIRQIPQGVDLGSLGHDFWLTRNHHGAGFWDRPEKFGGEDIANALTEIAQSFGEANVYVGDDGFLHL